MNTTPKPMQGTWTLTAPDGRSWTAESPLRAVVAEQSERVPAEVAMQRILEAAAETASDERTCLNCKHEETGAHQEPCYRCTIGSGAGGGHSDKWEPATADSPQPVKPQALTGQPEFERCYVCDRPMDGLSEDDCHCFHRRELAAKE